MFGDFLSLVFHTNKLEYPNECCPIELSVLVKISWSYTGQYTDH